MQYLFWAYLANAVLLIDHEIDSAYWKEWEMFGIAMGIGGFLLIHLPVLAAFLYGLVLVAEGDPLGRAFSLALSACGIAAFALHMWYIRAGRQEFRTPASLLILSGTLILSLVQGALALSA